MKKLLNGLKKKSEKKEENKQNLLKLVSVTSEEHKNEDGSIYCTTHYYYYTMCAEMTVAQLREEILKGFYDNVIESHSKEMQINNKIWWSGDGAIFKETETKWKRVINRKSVLSLRVKQVRFRDYPCVWEVETY